MNQKENTSVCVSIDPGICGFTCHIAARKKNGKTANLEFLSSECQQIQKLSGQLTELKLRDIFLPLTRNPVYIAAEKSGCHPSCGIPLAIIKAAEVALGMALARDVRIRFEDSAESSCPAVTSSS